MDNSFEIIIGLEVHAQLKTKRKMFCCCSNVFDLDNPNENICPICLGLPGTLPVANIKAIEKTIKLGLALGCEIATESKFDRKHYFYPDLPKGYQISQLDQPFCQGGSVSLMNDEKEIKLNRIHLEEDAGKLIHKDDSAYSFVDLNRAGAPLAEIVTEPVITSPQMAKEFLQQLQQILRAIDVSNADMEKGQLRCDANVNIIKDGKSSPIVEIKNLNSFRFLEKALIAEIDNLKKDFEKFYGQKTKKTRGFDPKKGTTYSLREKEEAKDYRYFPEPDLPPFRPLELFDIKKMSSELELLPSVKKDKLIESGVPDDLVSEIMKKPELLKKIESFSEKKGTKIKILSNLLINEPDVIALDMKQIESLVKMISDENPSSNLVRQTIKASLNNGTLPLNEYKLLQEDTGKIREVISEVIANNPEAKESYVSGRVQVLGFLIGQIMKATRGNCDPKEVQKLLEEELKK